MFTVLAFSLVLAMTPTFSVDYDGDGDVDMDDFAILQRAYGEPAMPFNRFDLNLDGTVGPADADLFLKHMTGAR